MDSKMTFWIDHYSMKIGWWIYINSTWLIPISALCAIVIVSMRVLREVKK